MPCWWGGYLLREPTCQRRVTWSYDRGGCRFAPGHDGPCKPVGSGRRNRYRPMVPVPPRRPARRRR